MTRIAGFDGIAVEYDHDVLLLTITCPSKYHAGSTRTGGENPTYAGFTPKQSQKYLTNVWARIRSKLDRDGIRIYGFRMVEPHHDATPHWHLLLFVEKQNSENLIEVCRYHAMKEDHDELGAEKYRFDVVRIDRKKGSAASYVSKYVSKSIDGYGVDCDKYGKDAKSSAIKIVAWARIHGIRQFQQIGGPPIGIWRELRRLQERPEGILGEAFDAADGGDWSGFVNIMGGPFISKSDLKIRLAKLSATDQLTGEIRLNQYMETASDQVYGVEADDFHICTRVYIWKIQNKPIGSESDQDTGQVGLVNRSDSTYRLESGRNVTLRYEKKTRYVYVT